MKFFQSFVLASSLVTLLFTGCSEKRPIETPAPTMTGDDADAHGCRASAGYQWSTVKKECVRTFELPLQLINADKTSGAGVVFSNDKQQAEVFSAMGTVILTAQSALLFTGNLEGNAWTLEQKNGKWQFGKKGAATPAYTEK